MKIQLQVHGCMDAVEGKIIPLTEETDKTIAKHITKLEKLRVELQDETWKEDKEKLPDSLFLNRVLNTMPREYFEFMNAWESVPKEQRNLTLLRERLCVVEMRLQEKINNEASALTAKVKLKLYASKKKANTKGYANLNEWYDDSGATSHTTPRKDWLIDFEDDCHIKVTVANDESILSEGVCNVEVKTLCGNRVIQDTVLVPGIKANLLYVSTITEIGHRVVFYDGEVHNIL
ncbi:hypothetical protein PR048_005311 [Dryococelus australis]|uniref:Retrovirus-related Pol polyprotein from transposon TNT 1-94-like beta-barrel domain-containing protein n=1 Tax=Dryococelus australis TaxID=614101 RepID=A0ABQ9I7W8_9NEOP|nr:hypothetical protein PR048_005311 [Dryococelus australis]